jgi:MFS family permease
MILVAQETVPAATAVLAWGVAGLGMGLSYAPLSLVVLAEAPEGAEGTAIGALQLCDTLGVALGAGVAGAILAAGTPLDWTLGTALTVAFAMCGAVAVFAAAAAMRLPAALEPRQ